MDNNRIEIKLPNGDKLVAEVIYGDDRPEIFVGIENEDGSDYQDLAMIGADYMYEGLKANVIDDRYIVHVWTDGHCDDYTKSFYIDKVRVP